MRCRCGVAFGVVSWETDNLPEENTAVEDDNIHDGAPSVWAPGVKSKSSRCLCVVDLRSGTVSTGGNGYLLPPSHWQAVRAGGRSV